MSDGQISHITVGYQDGSHTHITHVYAIDAKTSRKLHAKKDWLGRRRQEPTGLELEIWIENHKCKLDSSTGPARTVRYANGTVVETYYSDGEEHRADGPSTVVRRTDGSCYESYRTHGKFCRSVERSPDGTSRPILPDGRMPLPRFLGP